MTACTGRCGREGAGPFDSGHPELDQQFTWCASCAADLAAKRMPVNLTRLIPLTGPLPMPSGPQLNAAATTEHKIMAGASAKTAMVTEAPAALTDAGSFSGYLAAFGRDHGGDTIMPGALDETVAQVRAGRITWHLTDSHSEKASDIVATVTAAAIDRHGLRIEAAWAPTERAQQLRAMVRKGQRLGLSIGYYAEASRPDGRGGRFLEKLTVVGGAITPRPMNSEAVITEGKTGPYVPVVAWSGPEHVRPRRTDEQGREDAMLAAAAWPPPGLFDRATSLALIQGAAQANNRRELEGDPVRQLERARRARDEAYSAGLTRAMARGADRPGCRCQRCRWDIPGCIYGR